MKLVTLTLGISCLAGAACAQGLPPEYHTHIRAADSLFNLKEYRLSAQEFSKAFETNKWKGLLSDRYKAARTWALAGIPDSAFFQLERIVSKAGYSNYEELSNEKDLAGLHRDKRWQPLLEHVKQTREQAEAKLNKPLIAKLDSIFTADQTGRKQMDSVQKRYGWDSPDMRAHLRTIREKDSTNTRVVSAILDTYGWLGPEVVGERGSTTLFLVVQHADQQTQEKYLPLMREAVKNGKAYAGNLALLEDRVALKQGKKQVYGSQVMRNGATGLYYVRPLEDPDNVDKRRAQAGLGLLKNYVATWNIVWDAEQYKKDLPAILALPEEQRR